MAMTKNDNMYGKVRSQASATAMFFVVLILFVFSGSLMAMPAPSMPSPAPIDTSAYSNYSYIRFIDKSKKDSIKLTDEQFYDLAGRVIFPVNKYDLPKNDSLVLQLQNEVFPLINRDSLELAYMMLRGAASPEGPTRFNKFLGQKRAETILDFLKQNLTIPLNDDFDMEIDIEDYRTLCLMMRRMGDKDYGYVQALCDQYLPKNQIAKLKSILRTTRQSTLWYRLFREYFPRLRAARVVFFFYAPQTFKQPEVVEVELEPQPVVEPVVPVIPETPVVAEPAEQETWVERYPRRELLSVKTNLLFYGVYMPGYGKWCPIPNVAVEWYPLRGHFTVGASFDCPWWQNYWGHKYFQVRNYQLEGRYYFRRGDIELRPEGKGAAFRGWYLQAYGNIGLYGICFDEKRGWVGEGIGGGVGVGYVLPLSKKGHWKLEFSLQAGVFHTKYDPYQWENPVNPAYQDNLYYYDWKGKPSLFKTRQYNFTWIGPTRIGISLSYDLIYRKARKLTDGVRMPAGTSPTRHYNPLVPYEKHEKGGAQ